MAALCALGACQQKQKAPEENLIVDGGNIPANADIEALPPDESSGTSTEELANGADNPDVNDVNASGSQTNSY